MLLCAVQHRRGFFGSEVTILQPHVAAAAFVAHGIHDRLCAERTDEILQNAGILRVVHCHDPARAEQETAVVRADFPSREGIRDRFFHVFPADEVA